MDLGFKKVIDNGDGNSLIYAALIAAMVANAVPTVADGWYFSLQQKWKQQLEEGKITPEQYWTRDIGHYYTITAGYYGIVLLSMLALNKNSFSTNSKILLGILGGGLVIGVGMKNVKKDKEIEELRKSLKNNKGTEKSFNGSEQITCTNCGWKWNTSDSKASDKYTCHKCGKINEPYKPFTANEETFWNNAFDNK